MPRLNLCPWLAIVACTLLPGVARAQTIPPKKIDSKIDWVYSYAEGKKLGAKTGKPLFVVFRCER